MILISLLPLSYTVLLVYKTHLINAPLMPSDDSATIDTTSRNGWLCQLYIKILQAVKTTNDLPTEK